ncbi:phosphoribosylaminoimidazolesuccinocarboxamide synthase [Candidatus Woesearchaeota archaeon]|nr:phosphoribosylaminoimidazolesuccinocarboxamide synthase [Candidatus Woesearchaeota archaeon]
MSLEHLALTQTDNFPIRHEGKVHSGKVRSVYWLTPEDSKRLILEQHYHAHLSTQLGVMITSDRISAFDCNWQAEDGLAGVPGKGAVLNAFSEHWFGRLKEEGVGNNHLLDTPHPLVWIVQRARPVLVEAIARQYITGSMWRAYEKGEREFCGILLPEGLQRDQRLAKLLITPSTKGTLRGMKGIPEEEDTPISLEQIRLQYAAFQFYEPADVSICSGMVREGFADIAGELVANDLLLVDTKFEFGYVLNQKGELELIFMDEAVTPDSSRIWDGSEYARGRVVENSKEGFRQFLLSMYDREVLLNSSRMTERKALAAGSRIPVEEFMRVSETYRSLAGRVMGSKPEIPEHPREEIMESLSRYKLIE